MRCEPPGTEYRLAKGDLLRRIGPRYTRVFKQIDAGADGPISQAEVNELMAIEKIQRDVLEIYTWPFDTGVVVRLSVIVFSVTALSWRESSRPSWESNAEKRHP